VGHGVDVLPWFGVFVAQQPRRVDAVFGPVRDFRLHDKLQ